MLENSTLKDIHFDTTPYTSRIRDFSSDAKFSDLQAELSRLLKSDIPSHKKEFVDRASTLPFPPQTIDFNPKSGHFEFKTTDGFFASDYINTKERAGANLLGLTAIAEFFKTQPPGATAILFSPQGSDFQGQNLPETQIYYYHWSGNRVSATTLRLENYDLITCEQAIKDLGINLPEQDNDHDRLFFTSSTPIAFTPTESNTLDQLVKVLAKNSPSQIAYHEGDTPVTFKDLQAKAQETLNTTSEMALEADLKDSLDAFISSVNATQTVDQLLELLSTPLYDFLIKFNSQTIINRTNTQTTPASIGSYIRSSYGCDAISSSSGLSIFINRGHYKFIHSCGHCKSRLYQYMTAGDNCMYCDHTYLGC